MEGAQQTSVSVVTEVIGHLVREPDRLEVVLVLEFRDIDPAPGSGEYAANLFLREGVSLDAGREVCASCKRNAADRSGKPGWDLRTSKSAAAFLEALQEWRHRQLIESWFKHASIVRLTG